MTETSQVLQHAVTKVRRLPDPPPTGGSAGSPRSRAWLRMRPLPPGLQPSFLGALWFWHDGRQEARLPALHLFELESGEGEPPREGPPPPMRFINLFHDPNLGGATMLDAGAGWRRLDFSVSLPPEHRGAQIRALIQHPDAEGALPVEVGRLAPRLGVWHFEPASPPPPAFAPPPADIGRLRPGFVGGAPKSGTTWMQILLNQHPHVMATGEGSLLYNATVRANGAVNRWLPPEMSQTALNELGNQALLLRVLQTYREHTGCAWVIDKTPGNARFYRRLLAYAPQAKLIHCVRHPLDVVVSRLHHEANFIANGRASHEMETHAAALQRLPAMLAAAGPLPMSDGLWAVVAAVLDEYATAQREALQTLAERPGRLLIVRYEDMLADTQACAARAFAHLEAPTTPQIVADCVRNASFGNLADKRQGRSHPFFRAGTRDQFETVFASADQARAMAHLRAALPRFGELGYPG